jgi:hypothetical protein
MGTEQQDTLVLDGYSGYRVLLAKTESGYKVIKKSGSVEKNRRLELQHKKHMFFQSLENAPFCVPKVIGSGHENGLFYYEYEFVEGVTLLKKIELAPQEEIERISGKICGMLRYFREHEGGQFETWSQEGIRDAIFEKVEGNIKKCDLDGGLYERMVSCISKLPELKKTLCHGDFTFDNMIMDDKGQIWLIDFLDTMPHYWMDISKLFQDIDGGWYEIKHKASLPLNKLFFMRGKILDGVGEFDSGYRSHHNFLLALAFLRILPYASESGEKAKITEKIRYFMDGV